MNLIITVVISAVIAFSLGAGLGFLLALRRQLRARKRAEEIIAAAEEEAERCLLYTSPRPRDLSTSRMPSSA